MTRKNKNKNSGSKNTKTNKNVNTATKNSNAIVVRAKPDKMLVSGRPNSNSGLAAMRLPPYVVAQSDPFHPEAYGCKVPDENQAPTVTCISRDESVLLSGASYAASTLVLAVRPYSVGNATVVLTSTNASSWTSPANFTGGFPVGNITGIQANLAMIRPVAVGIKIECRLALTAATGFVHIAHVPARGVSTASWTYPASIGAMELSPYYRRIPIADLVQDSVVISCIPTSPAGLMYRDVQIYDTTQSAATVLLGSQESDLGWMDVLIVAEVGLNISNCLDVEVLRHWEGQTSGSLTTNIMQASKAAPHSPAIIAANSYVRSEVDPVRVLSENDNEDSFWKDVHAAFATGLKIATGVVSVGAKLLTLL
jgi:hypothetical protein